MKRSEWVTLVLASGVFIYSAAHHGDVYRDHYRSKEDCEKDWSRYPQSCEPETVHGGGGGGYYGPRYEMGARPGTNASFLKTQSTLVKRGGFGASGARFTGGGS